MGKTRKHITLLLLALATAVFVVLNFMGNFQPTMAASPSVQLDGAKPCKVVSKLLAERRPDLLPIYHQYLTQATDTDGGEEGDSGSEGGGDTTDSEPGDDPNPACPGCPINCPATCAVSHFSETITRLEAFQHRMSS